jgi:hypothetical protein
MYNFYDIDKPKNKIKDYRVCYKGPGLLGSPICIPLRVKYLTLTICSIFFHKLFLLLEISTIIPYKFLYKGKGRMNKSCTLVLSLLGNNICIKFR